MKSRDAGADDRDAGRVGATYQRRTGETRRQKFAARGPDCGIWIEPTPQFAKEKGSGHGIPNI